MDDIYWFGIQRIFVGSPKYHKEECCERQECSGIRLSGTGTCFFHSRRVERDAALQGIRDGGPLYFTKGLRLKAIGIRHIIDSAPRNSEGKIVLKNADFSYATFEEETSLEGVIFEGFASFEAAAFKDGGLFSDVRFTEGVDFGGTSFRRVARFSDSTLDGHVEFGECVIESLYLEECILSGWAEFNRCFVEEKADFSGTVFKGSASFTASYFADATEFYGTRFEGPVNFRGVRFGIAFEPEYKGANNAVVEFSDAEFKADISLELISVHGGRLSFDDCVFGGRVTLMAYLNEISMVGARFASGGHLRIVGGTIDLTGADFLHPTLVSDGFVGTRRSIAILGPAPPSRPRLLSLARANVSELSVSEVDLSYCLFTGSANLDRLTVDSPEAFLRAPSILREPGREVIAQEYAWRAHSSPSSRWARQWRHLPMAGLIGQANESPVLLQSIYRALRKGREDRKDEPGAADFYYGEMEMRRLAHTTSWGERIILTLYWVVSGYGMRSLRALGSLLAVVMSWALLLELVGFAQHPSPPTLWGSLLYTMRITLSITDPEVQLTGWGKLLQTILRVAGPVLLGLALLAVRNRVKR